VPLSAFSAAAVKVRGRDTLYLLRQMRGRSLTVHSYRLWAQTTKFQNAAPPVRIAPTPATPHDSGQIQEGYVMKTTTITKQDGTTVIKSQHSFGCLGWFAVLWLIALCITYPYLIIPTVAVLAGMFALNYKQHKS
jgi:hypothetical protein